MPRHPPCALKNLPHDHRTHRYHHHHTPTGYGSGISAINHEHGTTTHQTHPQPLREEEAVRLPAAPVLKMLASTIQFSNNNPHTLHTGGCTPRKGHDHRQDAGNPDTTPPPPPKGTGPVVSGPNSAPRTTPTTGPVLFHHPHRRNPTGPTTMGQVLGPDPAGNPHTRRIGTREAQEECGHLLVDIPPMSSPHQHHGRALGRGRPPHGGQRLLRKEVIQPHLPVRLPCYDFVPIASPTFTGSPPQRVRPRVSGVADFRDVTGGVYKARERIHRSVADLRLLATPTS